MTLSTRGRVLFLLALVFCYRITLSSNELTKQRTTETSKTQTNVNQGPKPCTLYNKDGTERDYKVVTFVDAGLADVFLNWLLFYNEACAGNLSRLEVMCLDFRAQSVLELTGLRCSPKSIELEVSLRKGNGKQTLGGLWLKRMEILSSYISQGIDVILSDSDAIWLKDPLPTLSTYSQDSEIVSSRAWWPWPQFHEWGSCLCMGYIYVKSNSIFSLRFLDAVRQSMQSQALLNADAPDDQVAVNEQLAAWNVSWSRAFMKIDGNTTDFGLIHLPSHLISFPSSSASTDYSTTPTTRTMYQIALLSHAQFPRKCHSQKAGHDFYREATKEAIKLLRGATVAHCRLPKGIGIGKERRMRVYKLWKLQNQWESAATKHLHQHIHQHNIGNINNINNIGNINNTHPSSMKLSMPLDTETHIEFNQALSNDVAKAGTQLGLGLGLELESGLRRGKRVKNSTEPLSSEFVKQALKIISDTSGDRLNKNRLAEMNIQLQRNKNSKNKLNTNKNRVLDKKNKKGVIVSGKRLGKDNDNNNDKDKDNNNSNNNSNSNSKNEGKERERGERRGDRNNEKKTNVMAKTKKEPVSSQKSLRYHNIVINDGKDKDTDTDTDTDTESDRASRGEGEPGFFGLRLGSGLGSGSGPTSSNEKKAAVKKKKSKFQVWM